MFWNIFLVSVAIIFVILVIGTFIAHTIDKKNDKQDLNGNSNSNKG